MKRLLVACVLFFTTSIAVANPYFGVNFVQVTYSEEGFPSAKPTALAVRLGNQINPNFALEGRLGFGMSDDTVLGIVNVEVDNFFGVYARGIIPLSKEVSVYGLIGYTDGELTASVPRASISAMTSKL